MNSADKAALFIFTLAIIVRAIGQYLTPIDGMNDYSWVTTFAAVAASWLSLGSRIGDVIKKTGTIEHATTQTTNVELDQKLDDIKATVETTAKEVVN